MTRTARRLVTLLVLLAVPAVALADVDVLGARVSGTVEVGGRTTWDEDNEAKFLEYRDLDEGAFGNFNILVEDEMVRYFIRGRGDNVGYDDQRYRLEFGRYGRYKVDLFYSELPHVFSTDARTLYSRSGGGNEFRLPAGVQSRTAGAGVPGDQLAIELDSSMPVDLRFRQFEGGGGFEYNLSEDVSIFTRYLLRDRNGSRAMNLNFGSPGGDFTSFAGPVDDQTHQVNAGLEYGSGPFTLGVEYLGSFYDNEFKATLADNPLVATDAATAASQGRLSLDPDNSAHTVTVSGSAILPTDFPARVTGSFAYGMRFQDDDFLAHTLNGAISSPALPRSSMDGQIRTLLGNVVATAQPVDPLRFKLRYRYYDYDDQTDRIFFEEWVRNDDALRTDGLSSVRNDYTKHNGDFDAAYDLTDDLTGHAGYGFEYWRRSDDRQRRDLWEHGPQARLDWRAHQSALIRTSYQYLMRSGDDYDGLAFFRSHLDEADFDALVASGQGEIAGLRKFDQANRTTHRADVLAQLTPRDDLEITLNAGATSTGYDDSDFGLTDAMSWFAGVDSYYMCGDDVGFGAWYTYEQEWYKQKSRWRSRSFFGPPVFVDDSLNNWRSKNRSQFHTVGLVSDWYAIPDVLDFRFGYEIHIGHEKTNTEGPADFVSTGGLNVGTDGGEPLNWPTVKEVLQVVTATASLHVTENLTLRTQYRFEKLDTDDFRNQNLGPYRGGEDVFLADTLDDYQAHLVAVSAIVSF